jgi:hypothetical protein
LLLFRVALYNIIAIETSCFGGTVLMQILYARQRTSTAGPLSFLFIAIACTAALGASNSAIQMSDARATHSFPRTAIVFTQLPVGHEPTKNSAHPDAQIGEGGKLMLLDAQRKLHVLTPQFQSAADPTVSFDGKRILFAAKKDAKDEWNIYEMTAQGSDIRQLTAAMGNCRKPNYQSAVFYLDDAQPSYQVTFVSDAANEANEADGTRALNLYSVRLDGSRLRRLTYGISSSFDPFQMQDGRILFSSWQRSNLSGGPQGSVELSAIHLDGTDVGTFSGAQGKRYKRMACTTSQRKAVFVESDDLTPDGSGTVATIDLSRNLHSYKSLRIAPGALFAWPSPTPEANVLISMRRRGTPYSIYLLNPDTGVLTQLYAEPNHHSVQPVVMAPRSEPDGHSSVVEDDQNWSKLYCLSSSISDLSREWMKPGLAKRVRLIEGLPRASSAQEEQQALPSHTPAIQRRLSLEQKRILGETELDEDGSFHLLVPPNTPMQVQVLDEDGLALRTSAWIWTKNKENRGCIGCHEDGELSPENAFPKALGHPAAEFTLSPERRRTISFSRDIAPIFVAKCAHCHPPFGSGEERGEVPQAYAELLSGIDLTGHGKYLDPGRARTSRLIWAIYGKNTSRPWDNASTSSPLKPMPPAGSSPLTEDEKRAIAEWIDVGAQLNPLPSHPASNPNRGQQ